MDYKNYTDPVTGERYINGHYVGVKHGTPTPDALDNDHNGYEVYGESVRHGSITPDKLETVNKLALVSIAITTSATKLIYKVGDVLDITGLVVTGTYSGGSKKDIAIKASDVTGFNSASAVAKQTLTITVDGKKTTYDIKIE
ncbi:bacterial Ig-like domain-containing protein [Clostridium cadaveris]|uniref:bacterial Ig-like domain-containing protein n=1 Tax=Clostridium cadaveris TaxID=1529 RepID=UPI0015B4325B|nr:bacterial Ig-like domain-containing protein [Clostridium cadaveris]NWK12789.1 bacterial Ig-like domain-containing protein [Clostridium cadaveris]